MVLVVAGENTAVTPVGRLDAVIVTGTLKLCALRMLIVELILLLPTETLRVLAEDETVKIGVGTSTVMVVEAVKETEVPVIVMVYDPGTAVAPAVKETVLADVLLVGLKLAVIPAGIPTATKLTVPVNPLAGTTLILEVAALPPIGVDRVFVAGESVNFAGAVTVKKKAVVALILPDLPVTITKLDNALGVAAVLAVNVNVLPVALLDGLKAAVTPAGNPETVNETVPLKLFCPVMEMAEDKLAPPATIDTLGVELVSVKLGAGITVSIIVVVVL